MLLAKLFYPNDFASYGSRGSKYEEILFVFEIDSISSDFRSIFAVRRALQLHILEVGSIVSGGLCPP